MMRLVLIFAAFTAGYAVGRSAQRRERGSRRSGIGNLARAMISVHGMVERDPALYRRIAEREGLNLQDSVALARTFR